MLPNKIYKCISIIYIYTHSVHLAYCQTNTLKPPIHIPYSCSSATPTPPPTQTYPQIHFHTHTIEPQTDTQQNNVHHSNTTHSKNEYLYIYIFIRYYNPPNKFMIYILWAFVMLYYKKTYYIYWMQFTNRTNLDTSTTPPAHPPPPTLFSLVSPLCVCVCVSVGINPHQLLCCTVFVSLY